MATDRKSKIKIAIFIAIGIVIFNLWLSGHINASRTPYSGIVIENRNGEVIISKVRLEGPAWKAGLRDGDILVKIGNNRITRSYQVVSLWANDYSGGQIVPFTIRRDGEERTFKVILSRFNSLREMFILLILSASFISIGFFIYLKKPADKAAQVLYLGFLLASLTLIPSMSSYHKSLDGIIFFEAQSIARNIAAILFLYLTFPFPQGRTITRYFKVLFPVFLLIGTVIASLEILFHQLFIATGESIYQQHLNDIQDFSIIPVTIWFSLALASIFYGCRYVESKEEEKKLKWVTWGTIVGILPFLTLGFIPEIFGNSPVLPYDILLMPLILIPVSFAFSIVKYQFMDIDIIIRRSLVYSMVTFFIGAFFFITYFGIIGLLTRLDKFIPIISYSHSEGLKIGELPQSLTENFQFLAGSNVQNFFLFFWVLILGILLTKIKNKVKIFVDRKFYKERYNYRKALLEFSEILTSIIDLRELLNKLVTKVSETMHLKSIAVALCHEKKEELTLMEALGFNGWIRDNGSRIAFTGNLLTELRKDKKPIGFYQLYENRSAILSKEDEILKENDVVLSMPIFSGDKFLGAMLLGSKLSEDRFNKEDVELLSSVLGQAAVAIENAQLHKELTEQERMKCELEIAHDMQVGMLPDCCPTIDGLKIEAISTPAKEVGGDFYDFIEFDDGRLGIIVGDVAGKGVSAAMIMPAVRSMVRFAATMNDNSTADVINLVNKRIRSDLKNGMSVTLLYSVLDNKAKTLYYTNAGQTMPLIYKAKEKKSFFLQDDQVGDRYPLGITEMSSYNEQSIKLDKRDTLIFYTDGVVEAMNRSGELYGFERFKESIHRNLESESIDRKLVDTYAVADKLLEDVVDFTGDVEQRDDLTLVRVSSVTQD